MKIMLIGSMTFAKEMVTLQEKLRALGHDPVIPIGTEPHLTDSNFTNNLQENLEWCIKNDIMRKNFNQIAKQDAVLAVNHTKNTIEGFIGISALMELGIAHYLGKKIFLLHPTPSYAEHRWAQEVAIMQPIILDGDLSKIN